jgi:hypothetical protein
METNAAPQKEKPDNRTAAQKRRAEFQEQQREYLRGLGLMQQIHNDLDAEITQDALPAIKFKTETRLKLLAKILPDMKELELTGPDGGPMEMVSKVVREVVDGTKTPNP